MNTRNKLYLACYSISSALLISACGGSGYGSGTDNDAPAGEDIAAFRLISGSDLNTKSSPILSLNPGGPGGSSNQSLRAGDVIVAEPETNNTLIGGLGVDILVGNDGQDIMIGGTEDFNSSVDGDSRGADNRDRAFGMDGDDAFIWAPGDGSDFFDGGAGTDVLIFGVLGELSDNDGSIDEASFFNVSPPGTQGSQDFDGIFLDDDNQPVVNVSGSPGFCSVLDRVSFTTEFAQLGIDHLIRFSLRSIANDFDAGLRSDDDGLRVAVSAVDVEYLVCTARETGIEVLDLRVSPPALAELSDLPEYVQNIIQ